MNNKGFTLVELLAAVVIMGILSTLAVVEVNQYLTRSKELSMKQESQNIYLAAEACVIEYNMNTGSSDNENQNEQSGTCRDKCQANCTISISKLREKGYLGVTKCTTGEVEIKITSTSAYGTPTYSYTVKNLNCSGRAIGDLTWPNPGNNRAY